MAPDRTTSCPTAISGARTPQPPHAMNLRQPKPMASSSVAAAIANLCQDDKKLVAFPDVRSRRSGVDHLPGVSYQHLHMMLIDHFSITSLKKQITQCSGTSLGRITLDGSIASAVGSNSRIGKLIYLPWLHHIVHQNLRDVRKQSRFA